MKKSEVIVGMTMCVVLLAGAIVEAAFPVKIPKVPVVVGTEGVAVDVAALKADLLKLTEETLAGSSIAREQFHMARTNMVEALGLKEECTKLIADIATLKLGETSSSNVEKVSSLSKQLDEKIVKKMAGKGKLSPEQKATFKMGLGYLVTGLAQENAQVAKAVQLGEMAKEIIENESGLDKARAIALTKPALELAAQVSGDAKTAMDFMVKITEYSKKMGIKIPTLKEATALLGL